MKGLLYAMNKSLSVLFGSELAVVLLFIPFVKPNCFEYISGLEFIDRFFDLCRIAAFAVLVVCLFIHKRMSKTVLCAVLYEVVLFFSTFINNGSINNANMVRFAVGAGSVLGFCILTELGILYNCKVFFKSAFDICFVYIAINFVLSLFFPEGIAVNERGASVNFIGYDNFMSPFLVASLGISVIYSELFDCRSKPAVFFILIATTAIRTWSATGVVGWFIISVYILFIYRKKAAALFNSFSLYAVYFVAFVSIVLLRLQNYFSFIIEKILKKSVSFTGRTAIWDRAIALIKRSPLIGYGVSNDGMIILPNGYCYHAHNAFLETVLQGGIFSLALFIALFLISGGKLYRYRDSSISGIISVVTFAMLMMMTMESYFGVVWIFGIIIWGSRADDIIRQCEEDAYRDKDAQIPLRRRYISYRLNRR